MPLRSPFSLLFLFRAALFTSTCIPRGLSSARSWPFLSSLAFGHGVGCFPRRSDAVCRKVFPVVLIICGVAFSLFFPPGSVPDGIYHFRTTYAYSNILAFQDADLMRASDAELIHDEKVVNKLITAEHWRVTNDELEIFSSDNSPVHEYWLTHSKLYDDDPVGVVTNLPLPQLKIPAALGIMFAKLIGLGAVPMFFLGRLFNMLYAAILIILAVRLTPIGKNMFMAASLMPMTLHILGSYSYDGPIIGMAFLLTALLLRAMRGGEEKVSKGLCIGTVAVASILAPCKVVYMTINFLVLFVPARRFNSRASCVMFKLLRAWPPDSFHDRIAFCGVAPLSVRWKHGGQVSRVRGRGMLYAWRVAEQSKGDLLALCQHPARQYE